MGGDESWIPGLFEAEALAPVMFFGAFWLLLLLLLPPLRPPGAQGHRGAKSPEQEADEPTPWPSIQRLREQLRTAGTLSKRYWALFSCTLWPDHCEDQETPVPPLGKSGPHRRPHAHLPVSLLSTASCVRSEAWSPHPSTACLLVQPLGTTKVLAALPPFTCPDFSKTQASPFLPALLMMVWRKFFVDTVGVCPNPRYFGFHGLERKR